MLKTAPLKKRIFVFYSILFLFFLIVVCMALFLILQKNDVKQDYQFLNSLGDSALQRVDGEISSMNLVSATFFFSDDVIRAFQNAQTHEEDDNYFVGAVKDNAQKAMFTIVGTNMTEMVVNIYNSSGFISTQYYPVVWENVQNEMQRGALAQIQKQLDPSGQAIITGPYDAYWTTPFYNSNDYIALTRSYVNHTTRKTIGTIQVLKRLSDMSECCVVANSDQAIYIMDATGKVLFGTDYANQQKNEVIVQLEKKTLAEIRQGSRFEVGSGQEYYYTCSEPDRWGLHAITVEKHSNAKHFYYVFIVLVAGVMLYSISIAFSLLISRHLTRPLNNLIGSLSRLSWNRIDMNIEMEKGELEFLEDAYHSIVKKLRETMNEAAEARLNEQEASYYALQSQISPHFLYNIIGNISASAYENNLDQVIDICEHFSHLLRYAADYSGVYGTVEKELLYTQNYLELMKVRYPDDFYFNVQYTPECADIPLPRMMIQTVVENSFKHAFKDRLFPWYLDIQVYQAGDWWFVDITDNGNAISVEKLQEILDESMQIYRGMLDGKQNLHIGGLGLLNSITRLRMLYQNKISYEVKKGQENNTTRIGGSLR